VLVRVGFREFRGCLSFRLVETSLAECLIDPFEKVRLQPASRAARNSIGASRADVLTHRHERRLHCRSAFAIRRDACQERDVDSIRRRLRAGHSRSTIHELRHRLTAKDSRLVEIRIPHLMRRCVFDGQRNVEVGKHFLGGKPHRGWSRGNRRDRGARSFSEEGTLLTRKDRGLLGRGVLAACSGAGAATQRAQKDNSAHRLIR